MLLMILMVKILLEHFMKRNYKKQTTKKLLEKKETNYVLNEKVIIIHLIGGLIKMMLYKNESILS